MDKEQNENFDSIDYYLHAIEQMPQLNTAEEDELVQRIEQGKAAKRRLLSAHRPLVAAIARKYSGQGLKLLDLMLVGNEGLLRAIEQFDATQNYSFTTYATWWIRQAMTRAIASAKRKS